MTSQALREARCYEEIYGKRIPEHLRPVFHLTPRTGWMNDPNGFCRYQGRYHLFYQYYPYASKWGDMHWGHAVSKDLLHWEYLPAALAPDEFYDRGGCFSGGAITLEDGSHLLMYTAVQEEKVSGQSRQIQVQCLARGDGLEYEKYADNPVLTRDDLPEGSSREHFRDPHIWRTENGLYQCVAANLGGNGLGRILLFESRDGFVWKYKKILAENDGRFGRMWECPDFFPLDGKQILMVSPQDMLPEGFEYHNGNGTVCFIGTYDAETADFVEESNQAIDYGIDFYAPQTLMTEDGRRVMIGWMQNWDSCAIRSPEDLWAGQMTIPRELSVRDGRLYQSPIREIQDLYEDTLAYTDIPVDASGRSLDGIRGRCIDLTVRVRPSDPDRIYHKFAVRFAQNGQVRTAVSLRPHEKIVKIDRKYSGSRRAIIHQRRCFVEESGAGEIEFRILLDRYSAEIFVNGGRYVLSAGIYTDLNAEDITFFADGEAVIDVTGHHLSQSRPFQGS